MAIALLARRPESLSSIKTSLQKSSPESIIETFPTSTSPDSLSSSFQSIRSHPSFKDLKLKLAVFSIKHSSKKPFMEETYTEFTTSLTEYVGGAFAFAQESLKLLFEHHGTAPLSETKSKKGTIIFTGTLGAMRSNSEYAAYGAGRAGVRQLAQSLGKEMSPKGVHVVHTIANGAIEDVDGEDQKIGKKMSADSVGKTYLWLSEQEQDLWTSELDLRPAAERY
jgi:NAD(P)-dependent dehydrogenase (short-subunit alcohol dehydrogenase family)